MKDSFGGDATFQLQTPLRIRKHERSQPQHAPVQPQHVLVQPQHAPVLPNLAQASSGFGIDTTVLVQPQHVPVQPQHAPVLPNLAQASSGFGITTTVLSPPPPASPRILDINPQYGPHSTSQRVWVQVQNLPRGNGEQYDIEFSQVGMVATSFLSEEGDQVQILECTTPITSTPCMSCPSLRHAHNPQTPIGSSQAIDRFE